MRKIDEAISAYQEACTLFPFDSRLANGYANIRKINDELSESLQIYEKNVRQFPYDLISKSGRADLLKRLGQYDNALHAYDQIIEIWPNYAAARNGKAAILVVRGQFKQATELLPTNPPETRDDWIAWHIRGMILLRTNDLERAIEHFRDGAIQVPFARERRYFDGALALARMRKGQFGGAVQALVDAGGGLSNILRLHAYAGAGNIDRAKASYIELSSRCPEQLIDLREAIATRFGITQKVAHHNDNWIFERESEAILREAA
jgi:tetratricopeptide (TPR) repeat protein